jgi:hypothetical protein
MRVAAIVCFIIAILVGLVALQNVMGGPNRPGEIEHTVGYAVGAFLVPLAVLIVGVILWRRS